MAHVGHFGHDCRATQAGFQDFGEIVLQGQRADGRRPRSYIRVDWFTPDGMPLSAASPGEG